MSAPRTWTLSPVTAGLTVVAHRSEDGKERTGLGAILDLLESLVPTETRDPSPDDLAVVEAFLREHGRLDD